MAFRNPFSSVTPAGDDRESAEIEGAPEDDGEHFVDGEAVTGDGDGEAVTGDGDGEAVTGDAEPAEDDRGLFVDGEAVTGDGDGEAVTGDGDGEAVTGDENGEWLAYELHEWASETRSMLAQLLLADGVSHSWQGTTLLAHESVEEQVDALVDEVERAEKRELDPDLAQVAFEMEGWSGELQALLTERLGSVGVPHEFDPDGDLVCHEEDEEQVEVIIDELVARASDEGLEDLDGLEANDLLSAVFGAADRLRRDVHDSKGVLGVLKHGRRLAASATPFGFAATSWTSLRDAASDLCDLIESEESTDDEIRALATSLRDTLQGLI